MHREQPEGFGRVSRAVPERGRGADFGTREEVEQLGVALREFPVCTPGRYIRHNPDELARAILSVWQEFRTYER